MKVIFLDFDGVITTQKSHYRLDADAISLLGRIIDATDAKIVVSSSWRRHTVEETIEDLTTIRPHVPFPFPYADRIIGITIRAYQYVKTDEHIHLSLPRGIEIKQWIDTHIYSDNGKNYSYSRGKGFNYVILDDDSDMLLEQADHFVKTNTYKGLTNADVEKAIAILNNPVLYDSTI